MSAECKAINLKNVFRGWAEDCRRGDRMDCHNTTDIEQESGCLCMYEGHHIVSYHFSYCDPDTYTATGVFVMDDGKKITAHELTADHPLNK